ncbi:hypothetical protein [uncultured Cohaesibacter sp.]|uniref:hypothetical protein n=1 Tax=uncultured Cohaesibacter sp. TaxID=1002546 RepID=UPI0029C922A8|nr:hypothetical protein [uncultured Cohaesibacter sp.]
MMIERFEELLDQNGTDLDTWPKSEQESARLLLLHSQDARDLFALDRTIARVLNESPVPKAPASLVGNIMSKIKK